MLFLLVGVVYDRAHHREIDGFGGLAAIMPRLYRHYRAGFLRLHGLPGLSGFISEILVLLGTWQKYPVLTILRRQRRDSDRGIFTLDDAAGLPWTAQ